MFKVASTTFRGLVFDDGNTKSNIWTKNWSPKPVRDQYWSNHSAQESQYRLDTYFKFVVVRHPFDRLLSAFKSKFHVNTDRVIARQYTSAMRRHFGSKLALDANGTALPTLEQFLYMVVTEPIQFRNPHWYDYLNHCHPCSIQYDHVIYMETLGEDAQPVVDHFIDADGSKPELPLLNVKRDNNEKLRETSEAFKKIDPEIIEKLIRMFGQDFDVFGYTWSNISGAGCVKCIC